VNSPRHAPVDVPAALENSIATLRDLTRVAFGTDQNSRAGVFFASIALQLERIARGIPVERSDWLSVAQAATWRPEGHR
jgi:hypothetical protein